MGNLNPNTKNHDEYLTPQWLVNALGVFDLDPCSPEAEIRPWDTALKHYSKSEDGFNKKWEGRVWMNPPYGRKTFKWMEKLREHGDGIALIFARTETKGFFREVWDGADAVFFLEGRIKFHTVDGEPCESSAGAPSCLVAYGEENVEVLRYTFLEGKFIDLRDM